MIPEIFRVGPFPINSFGLMVALAIFCGMYRLAQSFRENSINPLLAERYAFVAGFVGLLGARIWHILENWSDLKDNLGAALISSAGFTFYGGFIFSTLALILLAKHDKIKISTLADSLGPALSLAYAVGRLGCQLSGDGDYGATTTSLFGMSYETGVVPTVRGEFAYPTPLFESVAAILILLVLTKVETRKLLAAPFRRFGLYLVLTALARFFVEFLRINPTVFVGLSEAQAISLLLMAFGLILMLLVRVAPPSHLETPR